MNCIWLRELSKVFPFQSATSPVSLLMENLRRKLHPFKLLFLITIVLMNYKIVFFKVFHLL